MKARNRDVEKPAGYVETRRGGNGFSTFLAGAATILLLLLGGAGFWLYRAMESGQVKNPFNRQSRTTDTPSVSVPQETVKPVSSVPESPVGFQPSEFVLSALGNKAQVELVSVKRISGTIDEVAVAMRLVRVAENVVGSDLINIGATTARNPVTYDIYEPIDPQTRSSGSVSVFNLVRGQPVQGYVVLKVPPDITTVDIFVENTGGFKNVPIGPAEPGTNPQNPSSANPSNVTALPAPPSAVRSPSNENPKGSSPVNPSSIKPAPATPASKAPATPGATPVPGTTKPATPAATKTPAQSAKTSVPIKPGQFVQRAYGSKGEVELLSVKRIQDPETGNRDVVNVQMRIRRVAEDVIPSNLIAVGETTARNPVTSETYRTIDPLVRSTGVVSLFSMRTGASADAYAWLRVPADVNTLEIYVPETGAFKKVPISN